MSAATVATARIESDEDGWHLILDTDDGDALDFRLPHEVAVELDRSMGPVRIHEDEARAARADYQAGIRPAGVPEDDDPNHSDPEALAEAGDRLRKQRREEGR